MERAVQTAKRWAARLCAKRQNRLLAVQAAEQRQMLREELSACRQALQRNETLFNLADEPGQIERCIFQHRALLAQYDCLVRQARMLPQAGALHPVRKGGAPCCSG